MRNQRRSGQSGRGGRSGRRTSTPSTSSTPSTRSFVIIAVLVVTASALFIATGALFIAQAEIAGASGAGAAVQSRSLAWSGLQVVIGELDEQRERILRGENPQLDAQYEIYEAAGRTGVVRLLPITPAGERLAAESGKLDVNHIDAGALAATGMVDESLASSIIAYRDSLGLPMQSIEELLSAPGVTPEVLHGPLDEIRIMDAARAPGSGDLAERVLARLGGDEARGLADILTVFAAASPLQRDGRLRINLNVEWSDDLARRIDDRFGEGSADLVKQVIDGGTAFDSDRKIVEVLRFFQVEPGEWADILDALTADEGEFYFGRLDINTALEPALRALPGVTPEQAAQMIRARDGLSSDDRATIVWPLLAGILESEQYEELIDKMTVRSWTYRVRLAAGEVASDDPDGEMLRPLVWEAVIDLAAPRPRIAYLRDITMLQTAAVIAANVSAGIGDEYEWDEEWWDNEVDDDFEVNEDVDLEDDLDVFDEDILEQDANGETQNGSGGARIGRWKPS